MVIRSLIALRCKKLNQYIVSKLGVTIKFSQRVLNQIDKLIESEEYSTRSEFILEAVTLHLDKSKRIDELKEFLKSPDGIALIHEIQKKGEK